MEKAEGARCRSTLCKSRDATVQRQTQDVFPPTEWSGEERGDQRKRQRWCGQDVDAAEKTPSHSSNHAPSPLALTHQCHTHTHQYN